MSDKTPPLRPSPLTEALIRLQAGFARSHAPSAASYRERGSLLMRLGGPVQALADLRHAHALDPADPQTLALLCQMAALGHLPRADSHPLACDLLASPFATTAQRRHALPALDPARLPTLLRLPLPLGPRFTLIQTPAHPVTLTGKQPEDQLLHLGRSRDGQVLAMDLVVQARPDRPRHLHLAQGDRRQDLTVPPLPPPPARFVPGPDQAPLWIIMPLKDGGAALDTALASTLAALPGLPGARLILVDDGSTRPETARALALAAQSPGVTLHRTPGGLGFTGAVNAGLGHVGQGPVLLLNSDIYLPPDTLPRLLAHLADPEIGTVTPLSNNAGSLCLLGPGQAAALPPPAICDRLAGLAAQHNPGLALDLPNGNGFAMLISAACLRAIAPLSNLYDSGYYEEVDFCLRATAAGWRHVAACDAFIGHVGSVTYGPEKRRLVAGNALRLAQRFPDYLRLYAAFAAQDPLAPARNRLLAAIAPDWQPQPLPPTDPPHPGSAPLRLPTNAGAVLLPYDGPLPAWLRQARFLRLRLIDRAALLAGGLRLDPGHGHSLRAPDGPLLLCHGQTAQPVAESADDLPQLEPRLLHLLATPDLTDDLPL